MIAATHSPGETTIQLAIFIIVIIVFTLTAARQKRVRGQRSLDLKLLGAQLGFNEFDPQRDEGFVMGWGFLNWFSEGSNRYVFNVLHGTYQDQPIFVFDYHYTAGSGKSKEDHLFTIIMLIEKQEIFSQIVIGRENFGEKVAAALGIGNQIQFESAEFSRTFCVRSKDKKFAYDVCNAQMMEFLLANQDLQIEIQGPVISIAFEPQLPVDQIEFNLQRLAQIRSLMPDYLFTQNA